MARLITQKEYSTLVRLGFTQKEIFPRFETVSIADLKTAIENCLADGIPLKDIPEKIGVSYWKVVQYQRSLELPSRADKPFWNISEATLREAFTEFWHLRTAPRKSKRPRTRKDLVKFLAKNYLKGKVITTATLDNWIKKIGTKWEGFNKD